MLLSLALYCLIYFQRPEDLLFYYDKIEFDDNFRMLAIFFVSISLFCIIAAHSLSTNLVKEGSQYNDGASEARASARPQVRFLAPSNLHMYPDHNLVPNLQCSEPVPCLPLPSQQDTEPWSPLLPDIISLQLPSNPLVWSLLSVVGLLNWNT